MNIFKESTEIDNGRFVVRLPLKSEVVLENSYFAAKKRFLLWRRNSNFKNRTDSNFKTHYQKVMNEYLQRGHIKLV